MVGSSDRTRAGRYTKPPTGYRAFTPSPLPPQPPISLDGNLQACLLQADRPSGVSSSRVPALKPVTPKLAVMYTCFPFIRMAVSLILLRSFSATTS